MYWPNFSILLYQVNNLNDDPLEGDATGEGSEAEKDIDAMNLHILHELEDEM